MAYRWIAIRTDMVEDYDWGDLDDHEAVILLRMFGYAARDGDTPCRGE